MKIIIECATLKDIKILLHMYFQTYGADYPLRIGTDKEYMRVAIEDKNNFLWIVAKDEDLHSRIVASTIFQIDRYNKLAKVIGVVVSQKYQGKHISSLLIDYGTKLLLAPPHSLHSIYTTTRTLSLSSQRMFLNNGYMPLGIFPNAHKLKSYETLTLMAKFNEGILDQRQYVATISEKIKPILKFSNRIFGKKENEPNRKSIHKEYHIKHSSKDDISFEFIHAPQFVEKRFNSLFKVNSDESFYPFELPNLLIASNTGIELYASFTKKDNYCSLIACNRPIVEYGHHLKRLIFQLRDFGASYIETLVRLDWDLAIEYLLRNQFLPSAIYPALRKGDDGKFYDYLILSRTMQPLDFSEMNVDHSFKPYIDQYVDQWINMHISTLKVS